MSIPVLPDPKRTQRATQISEWIDKIEVESVKLGLEFEYLIQSDVFNCYQSIYTHTISWALHDKSVAKVKRSDENLLGNKIDRHIQAMSYGQTNGIPQGSILMDFIAEIVFSYVDVCLLEKINKISKLSNQDYQILRYRDDYRIFVHKPDHADLIMRILSETLAEFGMSLNTYKTTMSRNLILDSIKPDKIYSLNEPNLDISTFDSVVMDYKTIRTELIRIYKLGTIYPNAGSIKRRLNKIDIFLKEKMIHAHQEELVSILANIVFDSPNSINIASSLISKLLVNMKREQRNDIIEKLFKKFDLIPNSGYLEIWLQRITLPYKFKYEYKEQLCRQINRKNNNLFNNKWIDNLEMRKIIKEISVINSKTLKTLNSTITREEVDIFRLTDY